MNTFHKEPKYEKILISQLILFLPRMRRFARSLVHDPDQADDLVQEACEKALKRLDQYRPESRLDSWLYKIIYNRWIDNIRKDKTKKAKLILVKESRKRETLEKISDNTMDAVLDVKSALKILPDDQRVALILVAIEGYSYAEAAFIIKSPAGTIASRVARARTALVKYINQGNNSTVLELISGKKRR